MISVVNVLISVLVATAIAGICAVIAAGISRMDKFYSVLFTIEHHPDTAKQAGFSKVLKTLKQVVGIMLLILVTFFLLYVAFIMPDKRNQPKDENGFTESQRRLLGIPEVRSPTIRMSTPKSTLSEGIMTDEELRLLVEPKETEKKQAID